MSKSEIKGLHRWQFGEYCHWMPCGLNIRDKLWWRFMPGVVITVKWPTGKIKVGPSHRDGWSGIGEYFEYVDSADPNDHYRPELTKLVGKQGIHWNWGMADRDATDNRLTIKIIKSKAKYASYFAIKWS